MMFCNSGVYLKCVYVCVCKVCHDNTAILQSMSYFKIFFVLHDRLSESSPESVFSLSCFQYVFKAEAHGFRTVHEELAKGMTFDLKSNEHSAVRNVLKVSLFPHFILITLQFDI